MPLLHAWSRLTRRLRKGVQVSFYAQNFFSIWRDVLFGKPLREINLWNGWQIHAPPSVQLWNHFSDIWLNAVYTYTHTGVVVPKGGTILDIGANIGLFSIYAARIASRVIAIEPYPPCFEWLARNVSQNGLEHVQAINVAVAAIEGTRPFFVHSEFTSNSFYGDGKQPSLMVDCMTLGDILNRYCGGGCDFLKMDCEGAEYEILLGAPDTVLERVQMIALECREGANGHTSQELESRLEKSGYWVTKKRVHEGDKCLMIYARRPGRGADEQTGRQG